jgi:hypothetical protein
VARLDALLQLGPLLLHRLGSLPCGSRGFCSGVISEREAFLSVGALPVLKGKDFLTNSIFKKKR